jgi:hypothetical protein
MARWSSLNPCARRCLRANAGADLERDLHPHRAGDHQPLSRSSNGSTDGGSPAATRARALGVIPNSARSTASAAWCGSQSAATGSASDGRSATELSAFPRFPAFPRRTPGVSFRGRALSATSSAPGPATRGRSARRARLSGSFGRRQVGKQLVAAAEPLGMSSIGDRLNTYLHQFWCCSRLTPGGGSSCSSVSCRRYHAPRHACVARASPHVAGR